MPIYEFLCLDCGFITELLCNNENYEVNCENCNSVNVEKMVSVFGICHGPTQEFRRSVDKARRIEDMKLDLKNNYGVERVAMAKNTAGKTFEDTYNDIKSQGDAVKDAMKLNKENNKKSLIEKRKKWMEGALKRTPKRGKEKIERKKKQEYDNRKIVLS